MDLQSRLAAARNQDLLAQAEQDRQASRLRALRRASRRAARAKERYALAQSHLRRARSQLDGGL